MSRPGRFTAEEYLAFERASAGKNEWIDGVISAMSGGTISHDVIKTNITAELHRQLKGGPCRVFSSDVKVRTPLFDDQSRGLFTYPDVTVGCGEMFFHDRKQDVLVTPKLIFEVLSPSSEEYDRNEKRLRYQAIPSLTGYILVAQDKPIVEHWVRNADDTWTASVIDGLEQTLLLATISCRLPLSDVYDGIPWG